MLSWGLVIALVAIVLFIIFFITLGDGLLKTAAKDVNVDGDGLATMPDSREALFGMGGSRPDYVPQGERFMALDKGFDIHLYGGASVPAKGGIPLVYGGDYVIKMSDFVGMAAMPKLVVEVGAHVKAGDALFFDKTRPEIMYAAPVSGVLKEVVRGEKRKILSVVIEADAEVQYRDYDVIPSVATAERADIVEFLLQSGAWAYIRQRPYDIVADAAAMPKAIFVSTFDTAPLAPNLELSLAGQETAYEKGLQVLARLSKRVFVGLSANGDAASAFASIKVKGVQQHWVKGQHPAGNVGVHIHHIDPINMGEAVWTLDVHGVIAIGKLFLTGVFDTSRIIALTGAELAEPTYVRVHQGIAISRLPLALKDAQMPVRYVSGDVLSGTKVGADGHLCFYDDQVSVLQEGDYYEIFGWLMPQKGHPTVSRTFPGGFFPDATYVADTNTNGEKRAFVMTGQYESVLPMDILPQYLFRAIQTNDLEKMEGLGLLELTEEDVALCEYVCTSKQPLQQMLRDGLDYMREQTK